MEEAAGANYTGKKAALQSYRTVYLCEYVLMLLVNQVMYEPLMMKHKLNSCQLINICKCDCWN